MLSQKQLKRFYFDTVADMQAANLRVGEIAFVAEVNGFYKSDGSSVELINASGSFKVEDQIDFTTAEPGSPTTGDRYINTTAGTSSGTSQAVVANNIYEWNGTNWSETAVDEGDIVYDKSEDNIFGFNSTSWEQIGGGGDNYANSDLTITDARSHTFNNSVIVGGSGQKSWTSADGTDRIGYLNVNQGITNMEVTNNQGANNVTIGFRAQATSATTTVVEMTCTDQADNTDVGIFLTDKIFRLRTADVDGANAEVGMVPTLQTTAGDIEYQRRRFLGTFVAGDWTIVGDGTATLTITGATHGMGNDPALGDIFSVSGNTATKVEVGYSYDTTNGDIALVIDEAGVFDGKYNIQ